LSLGSVRNLAAPASISNATTINAQQTDGIPGRLGATPNNPIIVNPAIVPEGRSSDKLFRFLLLLIVAAAVAYFFLHYR
jgi:hypothetical protein